MLLSGRYGKLTTTINGIRQFTQAISIFDPAGNQIDDRLLGPNETASIIIRQPNGTETPVGARPCAGCNFFGFRDPDGGGPIVASTLTGQPISATGSNQDRNFSRAYGFTANVEGRSGPLTLTAISDYSHFAWRFGGRRKRRTASSPPIDRWWLR